MKQDKSVYCEIEMVNPYDESGKDFLVKAEHLMRYIFAHDYLLKSKGEGFRNPVVYDMACGNGYGTKIISYAAHSVFGFDKNQEFLKEANTKNHSATIKYFQVDLDSRKLNDEISRLNLPAPQIIVSFETIEHLESPSVFLEDLYKLLPQNGILICSIPNRKYEPLKNGMAKNPFHKHLFDKAESTQLIKNAGFKITGIYGQPLTNLFTGVSVISKYFDKKLLCNKEKFEKYSRILAYPIKFFTPLSYSFIFIVSKN